MEAVRGSGQGSALLPGKHRPPPAALTSAAKADLQTTLRVDQTDAKDTASADRCAMLTMRYHRRRIAIIPAWNRQTADRFRSST